MNSIVYPSKNPSISCKKLILAGIFCWHSRSNLTTRGVKVAPYNGPFNMAAGDAEGFLTRVSEPRTSDGCAMGLFSM